MGGTGLKTYFYEMLPKQEVDIKATGKGQRSQHWRGLWIL